jgi:hypothetical protein
MPGPEAGQPDVPQYQIVGPAAAILISSLGEIDNRYEIRAEKIQAPWLLMIPQVKAEYNNYL